MEKAASGVLESLVEARTVPRCRRRPRVALAASAGAQVFAAPCAPAFDFLERSDALEPEQAPARRARPVSSAADAQAPAAVNNEWGCSKRRATPVIGGFRRRNDEAKIPARPGGGDKVSARRGASRPSDRVSVRSSGVVATPGRVCGRAFSAPRALRPVGGLDPVWIPRRPADVAPRLPPRHERVS